MALCVFLHLFHFPLGLFRSQSWRVVRGFLTFAKLFSYLKLPLLLSVEAHVRAYVLGLFAWWILFSLFITITPTFNHLRLSSLIIPSSMSVSWITSGSTVSSMAFSCSFIRSWSGSMPIRSFTMVVRVFLIASILSFLTLFTWASRWWRMPWGSSTTRYSISVWIRIFTLSWSTSLFLLFLILLLLLFLVFLRLFVLFAGFQSFDLGLDLLHLEWVVVDGVPGFLLLLLDVDQGVFHHLHESFVFWSGIGGSSDDWDDLGAIEAFFLLCLFIFLTKKVILRRLALCCLLHSRSVLVHPF